MILLYIAYAIVVYDIIQYVYKLRKSIENVNLIVMTLFKAAQRSGGVHMLATLIILVS